MAKKKQRKFGSKRTQSSYNTREGGNSNKYSPLNWNNYGGKVPKFKVEEGKHQWNIVPFETTSKLSPAVVEGVLEIGELDYMLDVWVHKGLGAAGETAVICPKRSGYGKPCPICEALGEAYDNKDEASIKELKPSRRVFMNIQPIIKGKPGELYWIELSHYLFMRELLEEAGECGNGEDVIEFAHPENGKIVGFRASEGSFKGAFDFKAFKFLDRDEELDDDLIDEAVPFDQLLELKTYEELEALMHGQEDESDDEDKEEKSSKASEKEESTSEDDHEDFDEGMEKRKKEVKEEPEDEPKEGECPQGKAFGDDYGFDNKKCRKCPLEDECLEAS